jgi:uncharacterized membrane protein
MTEANANARLEALSDGVFAIAMTLLVIEVRPPGTDTIGTTADLWHMLAEAVPAIGAFVLSFTVIFITWVNHHGAIRSIPRTSASFLFANGVLLLTVAFIPFPTALLVSQAFAWILVGRSALANDLTRDDDAAATLRGHTKSGYYALVLYSALAVVALWFPLAVAAVTTATWILWLVMALRTRHG